MTSASDADPARSVTKADLEAILDSLVEGIVTLDGQGRILGINRAACEILEVDKDEAVAANCCEMMGKQLCESAAAVRDSIRSYRPLSDVQVQVQTRSGRKKVIVFQTRMLHRADDPRRTSVVVLRDVTELATLREDGPHRFGAPESSSDRARREPRAAEPETVRQTLSATGWNVAKAARRLGVSRTTLYKRIAEFGIQRPEQ